jgi:hypothetical protein
MNGVFKMSQAGFAFGKFIDRSEAHPIDFMALEKRREGVAEKGYANGGTSNGIEAEPDLEHKFAARAFFWSRGG